MIGAANGGGRRGERTPPRSATTNRRAEGRTAQRVAALLVLTALSLISLDLQGGGTSPLAGARSFVGAVLAPLERGLGSLGALTLGSATDERTAALQAEVDQLTAAAASSGLDRSRVEELAALL